MIHDFEPYTCHAPREAPDYGEHRVWGLWSSGPCPTIPALPIPHQAPTLAGGDTALACFGYNPDGAAHDNTSSGFQSGCFPGRSRRLLAGRVSAEDVAETCEGAARVARQRHGHAICSLRHMSGSGVPTGGADRGELLASGLDHGQKPVAQRVARGLVNAVVAAAWAFVCFMQVGLVASRLFSTSPGCPGIRLPARCSSTFRSVWRPPRRGSPERGP